MCMHIFLLFFVVLHCMFIDCIYYLQNHTNTISMQVYTL